MKVVVPLAGPDFVLADGRVKAEIDVEGLPLLRRALETRAWWMSGAVNDASLAFVLHDNAPTRRFADSLLRQWYPGAHTTFISHHAQGAALSSLAGLAAWGGAHEPICLDLADILYSAPLDPDAWFAEDPARGGLALTFPSDNPLYSYLRTDPEGWCIEAAEKRVISANASAGTYFFRNPSTLLRAVAHSLDNRDTLMYRNLFYACPLFNGVIASGARVGLAPVNDVRDIKIAAA